MIDIDKKLFRDTEDKLYRYFNKDKHEEALKNKLALLDKQIDSIARDLKECNISIQAESKSPGFDERVQSSSDGIGYAEREVMRVTELQIRRSIQKQIERQKVLEQLDNIEIEYNEIEWQIKEFDEEMKILLELKYKERFNEEKIAQKMHLSQSQVNKKKQYIINKIIKWETWNSNVVNA